MLRWLAIERGGGRTVDNAVGDVCDLGHGCSDHVDAALEKHAPRFEDKQNLSARMASR